jgi:hypothetical protein
MRYPAVEPVYYMVPRLCYSCVFTDESAWSLQRLHLAQLVLKAAYRSVSAFVSMSIMCYELIGSG